MRPHRFLTATACAAALTVLPLAPARAQQGNLRERLEARGLPAELVDGVAAAAAEAEARGLPTDPLADRALEGWAKRVPTARILSVVRQFVGRMGEARETLRTTGLSAPAGDLVAAAAEAMSRGMNAAQVADVVRAAPASPSAAPSLRVATALSAQGMEMDQAVSVVAEAMHNRRGVEQILDLPSMMRAMQARGMTPPEIGNQLRLGGGPGGPGSVLRPGAGPGARRPGPLGTGPGAGRPPNQRPPRVTPGTL